MLSRLGRWCHDHRWLVVILWIVGLFGDIDGITRVASPYDEGGERQIAAQGPNEGKIAFAQVDLDPDLHESDLVDVGKSARDDIDAVHVRGLQVELGGA